MDDEGSSWLDDLEEVKPTDEGGEAPKESEVKADGPIVWARPPPAPVREKDSGDDLFQIETNKRIYTHWARPIFLQYEYLYRYRHNYYDDWIDYLDRRQRGLDVEPPKPQTWAERALRGYTRDYYPWSPRYPRRSDIRSDSALLNTPHWANTWHSVHSKDYFNRKYLKW